MPCGRAGLAQGYVQTVAAAGGTMVCVSREDALGSVLDLTVGEAVHGGWCVARPVPDGGRGRQGPVVFVRHALPGERVRAVVTQVTSKFARADAVEIVVAAPERVRPPCPYAGPGLCGGCDWQHASLPAQRAIKSEIISQQLRRIAGVERTVAVQALPGDDDGLGWRTRVRFAVGRDGMAGLRRHRSHEIVPVRDCLIAHPLVTGAGVTRGAWPGARSVEVAAAPGTGERAVLVRGDDAGRPGPRYLTQRAAGREWQVAATGFWQVHPAAADVLAGAVLAAMRPELGDTALDLFCGAGLFAGVLAEAVGPGGSVIAIERDAAAARDARHNLRSTPWARVHRGDAGQVLNRIGLGGASLAVLDPPRTGADRGLIGTLCKPGLRRIAYVSCDPATLARDIARLGGRGWRLDELAAFDAFPMTHHVECLATLVRLAGRAGRRQVRQDALMKLRIFTEPQQGADYSTLLRIARATEDLGFDAFFRSDHYLKMGSVSGLPGPTDAWTTLAGLAVQTERIRLGTLVSPVTFRQPGPLAITVAQVDQMSGGRAELGLGTGWFDAEHAAYGIPFPPLGDRFAIMEEQLAVITGLWKAPDDKPFSFDGTHYTVADSPALPKPVQRPCPPVIIGGGGPRRTPRLAAAYADEYNAAFDAVAGTQAAFDRVRAAVDAAGRSASSMVYSAAQVVCCGRDDAELERRAAAIGRESAELHRNGLAGTPAEIVEKIGQFAGIGAERMYLQVLDLDDIEHLELIAAEVLPAV